MSDQNQFDQMKQKLLEYWHVFLAACGRLWENVKKYSGQAWTWLRATGKTVGQKLAAWALLVKEKAVPLCQQAGEWLGAVLERIRTAVNEWKAKLAKEPVAEITDTVEAPAALPEATEEPVAALPEATEEPAAVLPEVTQVPEEAAVETKEAAEKSDSDLPEWAVKTGAVFAVAGKYTRIVLRWVWKLRSVIMAIPVVWMAIKFARENMQRLPESVGLDIQSTGEFARMITREQAVYWPLGITAFCLVLMFCSKKPLLPWVISIFSLVLPWLIWLTNYYA